MNKLNNKQSKQLSKEDKSFFSSLSEMYEDRAKMYKNKLKN